MNDTRFRHLFERQIDNVRQAIEHNSMETILEQRKSLAVLIGTSPVQTMGESFTSAERKLLEMIRTGDPTEFTEEQWSDAVGDLMVTLLLIRALAQESIDEVKPSPDVVAVQPQYENTHPSEPLAYERSIDFDAPPPGTEEKP